jgi:hypothetical protein
VDQKHASHRATRIVEHPFIAVPEIGLDPRVRIPFGNAFDDKFDER